MVYVVRTQHEYIRSFSHANHFDFGVPINRTFSVGVCTTHINNNNRKKRTKTLFDNL